MRICGNRVQARLAGNACGSSRRRGAGQPSLLKGLVHDEEGRLMTPSHSGKGGQTQRYRYYVTRPDALGGKPSCRISATDLENLVCEQLAARIADPGFLLDLAGPSIEADALRRSTACADLTAASLRSGTAEVRAALLADLLTKVSLGTGSVEFTLCSDGLVRVLELESAAAIPACNLSIQIEAVRVRKGHQLKLVVPGPEANVPDPPAPRRAPDCAGGRGDQGA